MYKMCKLSNLKYKKKNFIYPIPLTSQYAYVYYITMSVYCDGWGGEIFIYSLLNIYY